ncbi:MAG TPA: DUF4082 domain-containing protein, partial [Bryobacteraceae bacterium]|nr:DUF4082 domain-containing protein [Bryobacteraceae bacterium]
MTGLHTHVGRTLRRTLKTGKNAGGGVGCLLLLSACFGLPVMGQTSIWPGSAVPGTGQVTNDTSSVTLGVKFTADVPGSVTAVRFYKGPNNTGTHVGTLWTANGTNLASVTFSG